MKWIASEQELQATKRADKALLTALNNTISRSYLQKLFKEGLVTVNSKVATGSALLKANDCVEIAFPEPRNLDLVPDSSPIEILHEEEHYLVLNKPQGLIVHPTATLRSGTLVNRLIHSHSRLSQIGGVNRPGIVHRLDQHTSGVLLITKSDFAHQYFSELFSKHDIRREYVALCYGVPRELTGKIENHLGRNPSDRKKIAPLKKGGRKAISHYKVEEIFYNEKKVPIASLIRVRLETGRTHQVRVHLTQLGHSLMGDPLYGSPSSQQSKWKILPSAVRALVTQLSGQALHAQCLGFVHPIKKTTVIYQSEPPENFQLLLEKMRGLSS